MGRPAHQPDPSPRRQFEAMAAYGIPETDVAKVIGIDSKTCGIGIGRSLISPPRKPMPRWPGFCSRLPRVATSPPRYSGSKTRARWREVPAELRHSGAVGSYDVTTLSREELMRIAASGA